MYTVHTVPVYMALYDAMQAIEKRRKRIPAQLLPDYTEEGEGETFFDFPQGGRRRRGRLVSGNATVTTLMTRVGRRRCAASPLIYIAFVVGDAQTKRK